MEVINIYLEGLNIIKCEPSIVIANNTNKYKIYFHLSEEWKDKSCKAIFCLDTCYVEVDIVDNEAIIPKQILTYKNFTVGVSTSFISESGKEVEWNSCPCNITVRRSCITDFIDRDINDFHKHYFDVIRSVKNLESKIEIQGKGLSTNDYTNKEKQKLSNVEDNAQVNVIEKIKVNGIEQEISEDDKSVNIKSPTKTSDLVNDSNFVNLSMLNEAQSYKVDKIEGKGLSTNDFTNEDKAKLLSLKNYDDTEIKETLGNKLDKFVETPHLQDLIVIANSDGTITASSYTFEDVRNFVPCVKDGTDYNIPCFVNGGCLVDSGKSILTFAQKTNVFTTDNFICFDNNGNLSDSGCKVSDFLTEHQDISGKEDISNKVTSISSTSTDTEYPSAKCVYDLIGDLETLLGGI